ncbi:hypothetical protein [Larkinella knui]|uniref:Uncharacterized protein n=1 Tax=Larkinella knui TaxID=2025310 RepID=A0A3P1CYU4_9BACT|nr:hypothetical protein [Larkinella knui]RRB18308.1 hypothetical protein EHT87_08555 [Larkinella knui]
MKERIEAILTELRRQSESIGKPLILPEEYNTSDPVMRARMERNAGFFQSLEFYNEHLSSQAMNAFKDLAAVFPEITDYFDNDPNFLYARNKQRYDEIIQLLSFYNSKLPN